MLWSQAKIITNELNCIVCFLWCCLSDPAKDWEKKDKNWEVIGTIGKNIVYYYIPWDPPKISLVILLTVYHTIFIMLVWIIWYWINWLYLSGYFSLFSSIVSSYCILYSFWYYKGNSALQFLTGVNALNVSFHIVDSFSG